MDNEQILDLLFWISLICSCILLLVSTMAVGKHVSDLQYQRASGLNGIRWTQSWVNLRTHANRVVFAFVFAATSVMGIVDAPQWMRTWYGRILFLITLFMYMLSSLLDWKAEHKQLLTLLKYEEINKLADIRKNLHILNNKLMERFNIDILYENSDSVFKNNARKALEEEITSVLKQIQKDVHAMDPSYVAKKEPVDVNTKE